MTTTYEEERFSKEQRSTAVESLELAHKTSKENDPSRRLFVAGMTGYWGEYGQGKSVSATGYLADAYAKGVDVFANDNAIDFGQPLDIEKFERMDYFNCIIYWDEVEEILNSYRSNSQIQVNLVGGAIQLRHQGVQIITAGQDINEINPRFVRRYMYAVNCMKSFEGRWWEIEHFITRHPGKGSRERTWHETAQWMYRYMPLYGSWRRVAVGANRKTASQRKASKQYEEGLQIQRVIAGAQKQNMDSVTVEIIQASLFEHWKTELTTQAIGRRCRAFGYTPKKIGNRRLAGFLTKHPNEVVADVVEEKARV